MPFPALTRSNELNPAEIAAQEPSNPLEEEILLGPQQGPPQQGWFLDKPEPLTKSVASLIANEQAPPVGEAQLHALYGGDYLQRIASTRVPDDNSHVKLEQLANMLDRELNGTRKWDVQGLSEGLFSDRVLGFPVRLFYLVNGS